jgi:hypothetical protein
MRNFFLSYSRADKDRLAPLLRGLERLHHHVWMDEQLEGGQQWWDEVLSQIRAADAVIVALSPAVLDSTACLLEFRYARAVGKPVVPVMIDPVNPDLLPGELARVQLVDFTAGNEQAPFDLMAALSGLPDAEPLPTPLPEAPPVPVSYLSGLGESIQKPDMTLDEQYAVVRKLKSGLERPRERDAVIQLMTRLRAREDLYAGPARELEAAYLEGIEQQRWEPPASAPSTAQRDSSSAGAAGAAPPTDANRDTSGNGPGTHGLTSATRPIPEYSAPPKAGRSRAPLVVGLAALLLLGGGVGFAVMNRDATPTPPAPGPTPARLAIGDECLVGAWVSTTASGFQTFDTGEVAQLSGLAGAVLTIEEDGTTSLDYADSQPLQLNSAAREMFAQFSGTTDSILGVREDGAVTEKLVSNGATYVLVVGGVADVQRPVVFSPTATYSCTSDTASFSDAEGIQMTYERR